MPRFALKIEYHGGPFRGWQRQKNQPSVQGALEAALGQVGEDVELVYGSGRTDTGVHAWGQVAHVDLARDWDPFRLSGALNYHLRPAPVAIVGAARVADDFHARFDAIRRHYSYLIRLRRAPLVHDRGLVWRIGHDLDVAAMAAAGAVLMGTHDFTTFRASQCQAKSPVKTLDAVELRTTDGGVAFDLRARSFLHNQVRSIVGTLERVGAGAWSVADVARALEARDRKACGPIAPSDGLYLARVDYPTDPFENS